MNNTDNTNETGSPEKSFNIEWTDDLLTGDDTIDEHHKEIIDSLNKHSDLIHCGINNSMMVDIVNKISYDVTKHFTEEEQYMQDIEYPDFEEHQKSHRVFLNTFYELKGEWERAPDDIDTRSNLTLFCLKAVKNHILVMDKKLALFSLAPD